MSVTIYDRSIVCPNQVGQAKYFFIVKYFSGLERGAGARLCPRRRSEAAETSTLGWLSEEEGVAQGWCGGKKEGGGERKSNVVTSSLNWAGRGHPL